MNNVEQGGERVLSRERGSRGGPEGFASRAVQAISDFLQGNGVNMERLQGMQGRAGGHLNRFSAWLERTFGGSRWMQAHERGGASPDRSGRFNRIGRRGRRRGPESFIPPSGPVQNESPAMAPEEMQSRLQGLRGTIAQLQFRDLPADGDPQHIVAFLAQRSIRPTDFQAYIDKLTDGANRLSQEVLSQPEWQNAQVICNGLRITAFNGSQTCVATGGQLLFSDGPPEAIRARATRNENREPGVDMYILMNGSRVPVRWEQASKGDRFIVRTQSGRDEIFSRHNDGVTRECFDNRYRRPVSITHFSGNAVIHRVNARNAGVPTSVRIEDMSKGEQLARGTTMRLSTGEYMGSPRSEIAKRGLKGYIDALAQVSMRELASYLSGIMYDQDEGVYGAEGPISGTQNITFDRSVNSVVQALRTGRGDCRSVAKIAELVGRRKGIKGVCMATGNDHMMYVWVRPSGDQSRPFVVEGVGNNGYWDRNPPGETPGRALANAWNDDNGARNPGFAMVMNDKLREGRASYDRVAAGIVNEAAVG